MDDRIRAQALCRGYVTRGQIIDSGYRDRDIKAALRARVLTRLRHGVYAYTEHLAGLHAVERHKLLAYSVVDHLGEGFVLSHQSACAARGVESFASPDSDVHVTRKDGHAGRREAGVVHHVGRVADEDITIIDGRQIVKAARSVFEAASIATTESGMVTASSALHLGVVKEDELADTALRMARWQGARHAALAIRLSDRRCESVGESRSLFMMWRGGVPRPEQQVVIQCGGGATARVDFDWDAWSHTGEFDGLVKYGRLNLGATDLGQVLVDEKMREDAIRGTQRGMSRWIWKQLDVNHSSTTAQRLLADLERSRCTYKRARTYIPLI